MKTRKLKRKRRAPLTDVQKWRAAMLAKFGGFSLRYIASQCFERPTERVQDAEIAQIAGFLHRSEIRLMVWRNGESSQARQFAHKQIGKSKERKHLRLLRRA